MNDESSKNSNVTKPSSTSNNKRRNNRNRKRPNSPKAGPQTQSGSPNRPSDSTGNKRPNQRNSNKKRRTRRTGPPLPLNERIYKKYDHLLEVLGHARKKYFELFFRADPKQKQKLLDNYNNALIGIDKFENTLSEDELVLFRTRYKKQDLDLTYTTNHEISPSGDEVIDTTEFPDPHYLHTQAEADYGDDSEESSGSIEDYHAYKGV